MSGTQLPLPPGGRLRLVIVSGCALVAAVVGVRRGCSGADDVPSPARAAAEHASHVAGDASSGTEPEPQAGAEPAARAGEATADDSALPRSCDAVALRASTHAQDAVVLAWLCPDMPLDAVAARAALLAVASPDEAARLAPRLDAHPNLAALARFVSAVREPSTVLTPKIERPEAANVSPLDPTIAAAAASARALVYSKGIGHDQRTRAHGYLAKVALQAMRQLGAAPSRGLPPLAGLLAAIGLHHGRVMAQSHWRRRVPGLAPVFSQVEDAILDTTLALQRTSYQGDAARSIIERGRARDYVLRDGPRQRIDARRKSAAATAPGQPTTATVWPLVDELRRLVEHGLVDRAVEHIVAATRAPGGPGLTVVERLLTDALIAADRPELVARVSHRLRRVRAQLPAAGTGSLRHGTEVAIEAPEGVADRAAQWLASGHTTTDAFARQYAVIRAQLILRTRPDATAVLLDRAVLSDDVALRSALSVLTQLLDAHGNESLAVQRLRARADALLESMPRADSGTAGLSALDLAETRRRRQFAAALRAQG